MGVHTCVPYDPESKGGTEATVKIAKADLVPTDANLREAYASFAELEAACEAFTVKVNTRVHRESARVPAEALIEERQRLRVLPAAPHTMALGQTRTVNTDQTVRFGSVRYSTPPGLVGAEVWVRAAGLELVIVADLDTLPITPEWAGERRGLVEVARHRLSTPGNPRIDLAHYPDHPQDPDGAPRPPQPRARSQAEKDFLTLGDGAHSWLIEASAAGTVRIRAKMAAAVELAALVGTQAVDAALGVAATAGRFGEGDLAAIVDHLATGPASSSPRSPGPSSSSSTTSGCCPPGKPPPRRSTRLVDATYERRSLAVTSNIHPSGFDTKKPKTLATAAVDRLLHHAHIIVTEGTSLRPSEATAGRGVVPLN